MNNRRPNRSGRQADRSDAVSAGWAMGAWGELRPDWLPSSQKLLGERA
jgi:hypothetical protein